jgi:hypothetical protein
VARCAVFINISGIRLVLTKMTKLHSAPVHDDVDNNSILNSNDHMRCLIISNMNFSYEKFKILFTLHRKHANFALLISIKKALYNKNRMKCMRIRAWHWEAKCLNGKWWEEFRAQNVYLLFLVLFANML